MRIEIAGGIASGKTTLAKLLAEAGFTPVLESFQANPFWRAFYKDPRRFSFETEITFLLQHYHDTKLHRSGSRLVCDFSFVLDRAYASVTLDPKREQVFREVLTEVETEIGHPGLLLHLECTPEIELERIRRRSRREEAGIEIDYLDRLNRAISGIVSSNVGRKLTVVTIDSGHRDFATDEMTRRDVSELIQRMVSS